MAIIAATALLYLACFAFYHANKRRSALKWVKEAPVREKTLLYAGWAIVFAVLAGLVSNFGWELAIPIWLGVLVVAGVSSILVSALWPNVHLRSAVVSMIIFVSSGSYLALGGAS